MNNDLHETADEIDNMELPPKLSISSFWGDDISPIGRILSEENVNYAHVMVGAFDASFDEIKSKADAVTREAVKNEMTPRTPFVVLVLSNAALEKERGEDAEIEWQDRRAKKIGIALTQLFDREVRVYSTEHVAEVCAKLADEGFGLDSLSTIEPDRDTSAIAHYFKAQYPTPRPRESLTGIKPRPRREVPNL